MTCLSSPIARGQLEVELGPKSKFLPPHLSSHHLSPHLISGWTQDFHSLPTPKPQIGCGSHTIIFFIMVVFSPSPSGSSWLFWRVMTFSTSGAQRAKPQGERHTEPACRGCPYPCISRPPPAGMPAAPSQLPAPSITPEK